MTLDQGTVTGLGSSPDTIPVPAVRPLLGPTTGGERFLTSSTGALLLTSGGVPLTTDVGGPYDPTAYYTDTGTIEPHPETYRSGMLWRADGSGVLPSGATFIDGDRIVSYADPSIEFPTVDDVEFIVLPTNLEDLLQAPPFPGRGQLIGLGDWRYCVEIALPDDPTSLWGVGEWGTAVWNTLQWTDLTPYCRGERWTRGADDPYGRPRIGDLDIEITNPDDEWSPFNPDSPHGSPAYFGPGTLVRVGVHSPTHSLRWLPQITCIVDSWKFATRGKGSDRPIAIHGFETLRDLAGINDNALPSTEGLGSLPTTRVRALLIQSGWQYGFRHDLTYLDDLADLIAGVWQLNGTDMALNRLAECYVTADSVDADFRTDRTGAALLVAPHYFNYKNLVSKVEVWPLIALSFEDNGRTPTLGFDHYEHRETAGFDDVLYVPYDADTFDMTSEDAYLVNDARFARGGGTQQTYEQPASISRYGRRQFVRSDLVSRYDTTVARIAQAVTARRGVNTIRIDNVDVSTSDRGDDVYLAVLAADIGVQSYTYPPDGATGLDRPGRIRGLIRSMTHRVTPRNSGGVTWSSSFALDTFEVEGLPAAQLPYNDEAP